MYDKGKLNSFSFRNAPITLEIEISNINLWHMVVWKIVWLLCICCCQYPSSTLWGHYDTLLINVPHFNNTVLSSPCCPGWPDPDNLDQRWLTHEQSTFSVQVIIYTRLQDCIMLFFIYVLILKNVSSLFLFFCPSLCFNWLIKKKSKR